MALADTGLYQRALRILSWRRFAVCMVAGLGLGLALSGAWVRITEDAGSGAEVFNLVIPAGTSERVARGESPPSIPARIELRQGDRLLVKNSDVVEHQVGSQFVAAGSTSEVQLGNTVSRNTFVCTFHAAGAIELDVGEAAKPASLLLASLLVGVPLGLASFLVISTASRI